MNLLSVSKLCDNRYLANFDSNTYYLVDSSTKKNYIKKKKDKIMY
jgi:hypothetical protein